MKVYVGLFLSALLGWSAVNEEAQTRSLGDAASQNKDNECAAADVKEPEKTTTPDMAKITDAKRWKLVAAEATSAEEKGKTVVHMQMKDDDGTVGDGGGMALVDGLDFTEGVIEVDLKGQDTFKRSFLGVVFHAGESKAYEVVYFRPFNFKAADKTARSHAVQYISLPTHTWQKLREDSPGKYEHAVLPAPEPEAWFHARIEVKKKSVTVFVDNAKEPSLVVDRLTGRQKGGIGLWIGPGNEGAFANLKLTPVSSEQPENKR